MSSTSYPVFPVGEAMTGRVARLVRDWQDTDEYDFDAGYTDALLSALHASTAHFNDEDMIAYHTIDPHEPSYDPSLLRDFMAHKFCAKRLCTALICKPEVVSQTQLDDAQLSTTDVLESIVRGFEIRRVLTKTVEPWWLETLNPKMRTALLCLAPPDYVDRFGHADLTQVIASERKMLCFFVDKKSDGHKTIETLSHQLDWLQDGLYTVCFPPQVPDGPCVHVVSHLLRKTAPGYFEVIEKLSELADGDEIRGPVDLCLRAQQAFAHGVSIGRRLGVDEQRIRIDAQALTSKTVWEIENGFDESSPFATSFGRCEPMCVDFATAANLAAFCRAITTDIADHSHRFYLHVAEVYTIKMSTASAEHLETWCSHVWPPDETSIDMYARCEQDAAFYFSITFCSVKKAELVMALHARRQTH